MSDNSVAALAVFGIFVLPVLGWIASRYLRHRERIEMIRHGIAPDARMRGSDARTDGSNFWRDAPRAAAQAQAAMRASGRDGGRGYDEDDFSEAGQRIVLRRGIKLTFIGIAITIGLSFIGYSDRGPFGASWEPGPWLLGGLIPTFIGLAQVVTAMLNGATLGAPSRGPGSSMPPFGTPPPASPPPPTYDSSYTYRPGDTQELRPPPAPPERRS